MGVFNTHDSIDHINQMMTMIGPMTNTFMKRINDIKRREYFHADGRLRLEAANRSPVQAKPLATYVAKDRKLRETITSMLRWEPEKRITSEQAVQQLPSSTR